MLLLWKWTLEIQWMMNNEHLVTGRTFGWNNFRECSLWIAHSILSAITVIVNRHLHALRIVQFAVALCAHCLYVNFMHFCNCDHCELGHLSIMHLEHYTHCVWSFEPGTLWLMELSAAGRGLEPGACIYCTERYKCLHILYKVFAYIARKDTSVCILHGVLAFIA